MSDPNEIHHSHVKWSTKIKLYRGHYIITKIHQESGYKMHLSKSYELQFKNPGKSIYI